jgi:hypothetical protein
MDTMDDLISNGYSRLMGTTASTQWDDGIIYSITLWDNLFESRSLI